uniref:Chromosome 6 open reading frame 136 n=1 Tax=Pelusios castaneus TaxID=367368 RepID=A0A8C8VGI7_9SAUR
MYQRSRALAGHLRPAARCWGRWGQGEDARYCRGRPQPQDLPPCWDNALWVLGPSLAPKVRSWPVEQQVEIAKTSSLPLPGASLVGAAFPTALEQKLNLHELLRALEWGHSCQPATLSPAEGMEAPVTTVDGQREDDISVREGNSLDSTSLDSLYSVFHGWTPFQATVASMAASAASASPGNQDPSMQEHLAVMYEKLQHELPNFLLRAHNYSLYSPDMEFDNRILHLRTRGRVMYQLSLLLCRFVVWNYFASVRLEVLKVTQHPENWSIQARWRINGLPFHVLLLRFYKRDKKELFRTYDAYSTFFLDSRGLIRCHRVDKLMPSQPPLSKVKKLLVAGLLGLGLLENKPTLQLLLAALASKQQEVPGRSSAS